MAQEPLDYPLTPWDRLIDELYALIKTHGYTALLRGLRHIAIRESCNKIGSVEKLWLRVARNLETANRNTPCEVLTHDSTKRAN